jgi:ABC-type antimicrobial peptide transport system permease subunit
MIKNYLKIAFRNILKNKIYILINVSGMGIALAFCLTIYIVFAFNNEFDNYYRDVDQIVRLHEFKQNASGEIKRYELAPIPMGPMIADEITGVEDHTRFIYEWINLKHGDLLFREEMTYVDPNFFKFFPIKLKSGFVPDKLDNSSIYLTEECARKYFGEQPALNKIFTVYFPGGRSVDLRVAGVFNRIPLNSSFIFDALTSFDHFLYGNDIGSEDWTSLQQASVYLKLNKLASIPAIESQLSKYVTIQNEAREEWKVSRFELVEFKNKKIVKQGVINGGNASFRLADEVVIIFIVLSLLILLIACFNLANTSMALMSSRVREIGVRKVMGGRSAQLFLQFLLEMSFTSLLAFLFGLAMFTWISNWFFSIWGETIHFSYFSKGNFLIAFLLLFLFTSVISGIYPALYSRKFNPADIFRNQIKLKGSSIASRIMNGFQFAICITMLIAGIVFSRNADFLRDMDYGYKRDGLVVVSFNNSKEYDLLKDKIQARTNITGYSGTKNHFGYSHEDTNLILDSGNIEIRSYLVGNRYLKTMGVDLISGRLFREESKTDLDEAVIVNEEYVKKFNLDDPIGEMVNLKEGRRYIVGVVRNIIWNIYSESITIPEVYMPINEDDYEILIVRANDSSEKEVYAFLEESWKDLIPDRPFTGKYQDDLAYGYAMQDNSNMQQIFYALAILGGILSLTGIFALSSLNVTKRFKEIGIRKVMGASSRKIIVQLNTGFFWTLIISSIAGSVLGYVITNLVLSIIYKYHIEVGAGIMIAGGFIVIASALITTTFTIFKAANTNPAFILRNE